MLAEISGNAGSSEVLLSLRCVAWPVTPLWARSHSHLRFCELLKSLPHEVPFHVTFAPDTSSMWHLPRADLALLDCP